MSESGEIGRLYKLAVKDAQAAAGGPRAFVIIGPTLRRGLVGDAILGMLYRQDDEAVSAARVRELLIGLRHMMMEDEGLDT